MSRKIGRKKLAALIGIPASLVLTRAAWAQTSTWIGTGPDNLWTDTANWDTGFVPISGSTAAFVDISSGFTSVDLGGAAQPINTIAFNGNSTSYTLGLGTAGDAFNFDANGAITVASTESVSQLINAQLNTSGSMTITNNGVSSLTLGGNVAIGGGGALSVSSSSGNSINLNGNISNTGGPGVTYNLNTAAGAGNSNIAINGNNTYGGTTAINDTPGTAFDVIQVGTDTAFSTGKIIVTGGTSLLGIQLQANNGTRTLNNAVDLNGSVVFTGNSMNINGPINVINTAGGTSRVLTDNLGGGTLTYGASTSSASTITLGNPTSNGGDGAGRTLFFGSAANTTTNINDVMKDPDAGAGSVGYVGASGAVYNVNSLNTYSGPTFFGGSAGSIVRFNNSYTAGGTSGPFGTGTLVFNNTSSPSTLAPVGGGTITLANPVQFLGLAGFTNVAGDNTSLVLNGPISFGTVGRTVTNSLSAANTLTYGATLNAQTITMPAANGQTVAFNGPGATIINDAISNNGTFTGLVSFNISSGMGTVTVNGSLAGLAGSNLQWAGASSGANVGTINFNTAFSGTGNINASLSGNANINSQSTFSGGINFGGANALITITTSTTQGTSGAVASGPFGIGTTTFTQNASSAQRLRPFGGNQTIANAILWAGNMTVENAPADTSSLALTGNINMGTAGRTITNNFAKGATFTLGAATSPATITLPTFVPAVQTLVFAGSGNTIINDSFQQASGTTRNNLQINGGTGGSVTINGNFNLGGGSLQFNSGTSGTITVNGNLNLAGGNLTLSGVTNATAAGFNILNAPFSGSGSLTIGGSDLQMLNDQSTFTGGTTISGSNVGGVIELPVSSVMSGTSVVSGPFGVNGITIVALNPTRLRPINANQLVGNSLVLQQLLTMDNNPGDTFGLTFAGPIAVATNNVTIANGFFAGQTAGTLTLGLATNPATITLTATNAASGQSLTFNALNGPIVVNDTMLDGTKVGTVQVNTAASATGTVTFTGTNSFSGGTIINGGTLSVSSDSNLGAVSGTVSIGAGTLLATASGTSVRNFNVTDPNATIDVTAGSTLNLGGTFGGAGNLTKGSNAGTLQLSQPSGFTLANNVSVNGGLLAFGATSTFTNTPNGPVVNGGGLSGPVSIGGAFTINAGAKAAMNPSLPGTGQTNSIGSLSIGNGGALDIGNHTVIVQNAPDETVIGKYLTNGYSGGFWNGTSPSGGAIQSVVAFNDNSGATSVGYGNSNDFTFGGSTSPYRAGGPKALSGNQVVVAPALEGDLLLEGSVGPDDLAFVLNAFGTTGNDWAFGNIDYDAAGLVGPNDLSLLLSNFGHSSAGFAGAKTSAKSLTSTAKPSLVASSSDVVPPPADGIELIVNTSNGDVELEGNLATLATSVVLTSPGNTLIGGTTFTPAFHALFDTTASNTSGLIDEFNTFANGSTVDGIIDMGNVYNAVQNSEDVQFQFSEKGINRGGLQTGSVFYVTGVPEPTTMSLLAIASAGLLGRRRKRQSQK